MKIFHCVFPYLSKFIRNFTNSTATNPFLLTQNYNKMKKTLLITALLLSAASTSFAKTEGNYGSVGVLFNRASLNQGTTNDSINNAGVALGYKHAINFNNAFIAPGVFWENNNLKSNIGTTNVNLKNRYGFKVDLGYDLEDDLAVYLTGGLSFLNVETANASGKKSSSAKSDFFYGVGISHDYSKKVTFSLEYNTQDFDLKVASGSKIKVTDNIVKVGLNYKF